MSAELAQHAHGHEGHSEHLAHQFEDMDQQNDSYVVGMWTFLVTEIMFFGALFLAYTIYRLMYPEVFAQAHQHLNVWQGGVNTMVLLTSSYFMAMAVHAAQIGRRKSQMGWMVLVLLCALTFLVIKGFEYYAKYEHHLIPGPTFHYEPPHNLHGEAIKIPEDKAQMFFCLYFAMTGLHGIHVLIGMVAVIVLLIMIKKNHPATRYYMPTEMFGLYWHFVDIVWIFLFPLYYLIPK